MEVNFFFQLRYRSLGLHCFSGVIVRQIIPWSFFFLQRFEVTGVLVTIKTGLKSVARGYKSQTILLRRSALVSSYLSRFP